jgi:hypothetical protein
MCRLLSDQENPKKMLVIQRKNYPEEWSTVELHLSGSWLPGSPIIRIGLALRVNISLL